MWMVGVAWSYVVVMMTIAEATSDTGTVLGALVTFVLYGVLPLSIALYLIGTPGRRRRAAAIENPAAPAAAPAPVGAAAIGSLDAATSLDPDRGRHPSGDAIAPE